MTHHTDTDTPKSGKQIRVFVEHAEVLPDEKHRSLSDKEKDFETSCEKKGVWLEIFCPEDACFSEEDRFRVPVFCEDPKAKKALWLDLFCPGESCEVVDSTKLP